MDQTENNYTQDDAGNIEQIRPLDLTKSCIEFKVEDYLKFIELNQLLFSGWLLSRRHLMTKFTNGVGGLQDMHQTLNQTVQQPFNNNQQISHQHKIQNPNEMPEYISELLKSTEGEMVVLGPNGTAIKKKEFTLMNWSASETTIARKILVAVFTREVLASHTLSGKPSPAFVNCNKPPKFQLDPEKVDDIIYILKEILNLTAKEIRHVIVTKCADECKMRRMREQKKNTPKKKN